MFSYFMDTSSEKFHSSMHGAKYDTMAHCMFFWAWSSELRPLAQSRFFEMAVMLLLLGVG